MGTSLLAIASCSAVSIVETVRYTLPPVELERATHRIPYVLRISDFEVAPHLETEHLLTQFEDARIVVRSSEAWSAPLGSLVTNSILAGLLESERFRAVVDDHEAARAQLVLRGRVEDFEEWRDGGTRQAAVTVGFVLSGEDRGEILLQKRVEAKVPLQREDGATLVHGLHRALGDAFRIFLSSAEESAGAWSAPDR
ncbi:MAG: membrane integrity-associated transporter subunit PqiC [Planctomycetes bacterium]|nr:membrane integrity-associated transporter subunit PqiC [Planctomycetota bacterium]